MTVRSWATLVIVHVLACSVAFAAPDTAGERPLAGRSLSDVLRELQKRGMKIVFSSEVVRPAMRVTAEPRSTADRERLDEILRPHGLEVHAAPKGVLLVVRRRATPDASAVRPATGIRGLVVDAQSATPLPGVLVRLQVNGREAVSDAEGRFEFDNVPPGPQRLFVSLVGYALAEPEVTVVATRPLELTVALATGATTYTEEVNVVGDRFRGTAREAPSAMVLDSGDLRELRGVLTDDPFRAVQALPSATSDNDFRSEFSIRGSDFRHVGLTIDGLATGWPVHSVRGDPGSGSVALINADVLDSVTLLGGAYPQEQPARSGGWIDLILREGSRVRTQAHGSLSMTAASLVTEGPLGNGSRGSWLVSARQSYLQWILKRMQSEGTAFGYGDVLGKLVVDVTPRQQFQVTALAGRSLLDLERADPDPNLVTRGSSSSALFTTTWRWTGSRAMLLQKIGLATDRFTNDGAFTAALGEGSGHQVTYRADATVTAGATLRFGVQTQHESLNQSFRRFIGFVDRPRIERIERIDGSRSQVMAFARGSGNIASRLSLDAGVLVSGTDGALASPWGAASLPAGPWTLRAAGGIYRQIPGLDQEASSFTETELAPEWSRHLDAALERRWRGDMRAQLTAYWRHERDVLRLAGDEFRQDGPTLLTPSLAPRWQNTMRSRAQGIEIMVQRRASTGISGWAAYAYGTTTAEDARTGERFDGDFDQRHSFTVFASYRRTPVTAFSGKLRIGSNFPLVGYLASGDGGITIGSARNQLRLPTYARLDLRLNRAFNLDSRRLTLFAEIVNVLGRTNEAASCACLGWADSPRVASNGRVVSVMQPLFPFLPTAGIVIDF